MVGVLTPNRTLQEWRMVFFISCAFLVSTNIIFIAFATGKTQVWNNPGEQAAANKALENGSEIDATKKQENGTDKKADDSAEKLEIDAKEEKSEKSKDATEP